MSRTVTTVLIARALEDVWAFLSDAQNLPAWCPEADQVTQLSDGPFATGTKFLVAGRIGPLRFRSTQEVTALEPHRAIELRSVDGLIGGSLLTRVDIAPDGARTILTGTSDVQGVPSWLAVLRPGKQRDREAFFARLKDSLEAQVQPATPPVANTGVERLAARTEPKTRDPDPEPLAESPPATRHPSVGELPVSPLYRTDVRGTEADAAITQTEEPTTQSEVPTAQAEVPAAQAEEPTAQAEAPAAEEDVPELVGGGGVAADASAVTASESAAVDVAPARRPVRKARAAADERVEISHAPPVEDVRLVLRLETERGPSATFEITRSGATIGRAPENTVRLDDLSVSRQHARISYRQGGYWLNDLKSASGTWVDETKLSAPRRLAPDQSIRIGILRLTAIFLAAGDELPTGDAPAPASEPVGRGQGRR